MTILNLLAASPDERISVKRLYGQPRIPKPGETDWLLNVYGFAYALETKFGDRGPSVVLRGDFIGHTLRAIGRKDPKIRMARSQEAFLTDPAIKLIMDKGLGTTASFVEFAVRIGIKGDLSTPLRFVDVCEPLMDMVATSPLEALIGRLDPALYTVEGGAPDMFATSETEPAVGDASEAAGEGETEPATEDGAEDTGRRGGRRRAAG